MGDYAKTNCVPIHSISAWACIRRALAILGKLISSKSSVLARVLMATLISNMQATNEKLFWNRQVMDISFGLVQYNIELIGLSTSPFLVIA